MKNSLYAACYVYILYIIGTVVARFTTAHFKPFLIIMWKISSFSDHNVEDTLTCIKHLIVLMDKI